MSNPNSKHESSARSRTSPVATGSAVSVARRTSGQKHGPVTRLMSPSDLGQFLKPFVFLVFVQGT